MQTLLLGYGDISQRTARLLAAEDHRVTGLCRHPDNKPVIDGVQLLLVTMITSRTYGSYSTLNGTLLLLL